MASPLRTFDLASPVVIPKLRRPSPCVQKLDRLRWTSGVSVDCWGARFGIRTNDPKTLSLILKRLPPHSRILTAPHVPFLFSFLYGGTTRPGIRRFHLAYADSERIARSFDLDEALEALESAVRLYVAENARTRIFLHAGVLEFQDRALLVPGRSYSGKSTLVKALVAAGGRYYSDEFAVMDARGRVQPFALPLSHRDAAAKVTKIPMKRSPDKAIPVAWVALTEFKKGGNWRPRVLSPGRSVLGLLNHAPAVRLRPAAILKTLQKVANRAIIWKGSRGEAKATVKLILARIGARHEATRASRQAGRRKVRR